MTAWLRVFSSRPADCSGKRVWRKCKRNGNRRRALAILFILPFIQNIDKALGGWEYAHMETTLVKADDKGRVPIRGARKGAKYLVTAESGGWWIWELRAATLESFYDPAKAW